MSKNKRNSASVKANDDRYGLKAVLRCASTLVVSRVLCVFCIMFSREKNVGVKRKITTNVQGWSAPFCYDNIELHMKNQHAVEFVHYESEMMYSTEEETSDVDDNDEQELAFGGEAEREIVVANRRASAVKTKERAMALFKRNEPADNDDKVPSSYIVTIAKSKTQLFNLAI
ncbi:hypothetical protein AXG93_2839s1560 [Marchantia polymorpha subsp. ruderalis]|uniref:Uncharacterized protein n=1 Tax=Marchantia polymorpha subsp. ruderalis TaxID=1480154 RepID=A0A176VE27_MARPO|nr:hypothetical protein AXG93_2839s1560 [Marchantia polymorpha subsp. ruderalis]